MAFTYYTSPHEISRVDATVKEHLSGVLRKVGDEPAAPAGAGPLGDSATTAPPAAADFVWLHKPSRATASLREQATVCSQLSGIGCLEDKASLAQLQKSMAATAASRRPPRRAAPSGGRALEGSGRGYSAPPQRRRAT